jgi:hypothetical protein
MAVRARKATTATHHQNAAVGSPVSAARLAISAASLHPEEGVRSVTSSRIASRVKISSSRQPKVSQTAFEWLTLCRSAVRALRSSPRSPSSSQTGRSNDRAGLSRCRVTAAQKLRVQSRGRSRRTSRAEGEEPNRRRLTT